MTDDVYGALEIDRTGYDPTTDTYHDTHDWESDHSLATTIVEAMADLRDVSPMDLDQLHHAVDPEALERALRSMPASDGRARGCVQLAYADCLVTVASTGELTIDCDP